MSKEAIKLAFEWYDSGNEVHEDFVEMIQSVIALAKQEQGEPVAWPTLPPSKGQSPVLFDDGYAEGWARCLRECKAAVANTTPPQSEARGLSQQQPSTIVRKPLTDEYVTHLWVHIAEPSLRKALTVFARAIEAAHGIAPQAKQAVPECWKLVPIEPTDEMLAVWLSTDEIAGGQTGGHMQPWMKAMRLYKSMLAAAPQGSDK